MRFVAADFWLISRHIRWFRFPLTKAAKISNRFTFIFDHKKMMRNKNLCLLYARLLLDKKLQVSRRCSIFDSEESDFIMDLSRSFYEFQAWTKLIYTEGA